MALTEETDAPRKRRGGTLNTIVYEAIKQRIFANQLRQGNKLTHTELAAILGVSRTPVREALERLTQEGFVVRYPNRGYYVAEIEQDEVVDLFELREALELHALRRSSRNGLSKDCLEKLEEVNERYARLIRDDRTRERMMADRDFHMTLASFAGNAALLRALDAAFERLILKLNIDGYTSSRGRQGLREHQELVKALWRSAYDEAEELLREHVRNACGRVISHIEQLKAPKYYRFRDSRS